ncbi:MAG: hypothetical protein AAGF30_00260 [Pseudomonadota bacterium]
MSHDEGQNTLTGRTRRQEMSDKLTGYGEGVVHGWEAAARAVSYATNGLFTLQETREIKEWRARLARSK